MQYAYAEFVWFPWREIGTLFYPFLVARSVWFTIPLWPFCYFRYYTWYLWYLKEELATRRAVTVTQVSRNFYQTIRAARHCPWELCADTSHSFPESRLSMSTEKAFGSSYWSIKSYKKYDSYREPIQMLIYLARIILSNTRINIIFY